MNALLSFSACLALIVACTPAASASTRTGVESSSARPLTASVHAPAPSAVVPPLKGRIFFARAGGRYGDETIFTANANGRGERALTEPNGFCCHDVSPDHRRLLVMTEEQPPSGPITGGTIRLSGGGVERLRLTDPTLNLVPQRWSPDGTRIAYEGWDDGDPSRTGVYTTSYPEGDDLARVTVSSGDVHDIPADWSPDGTRIVFFRSGGEQWDVGGSLWVANRDGSTAAEELQMEVEPSWWARWSPDGSRILFASARLQDPSAIWTIEPDGSNLTKVWEDASGGFPITPTWSPDGSQIMFALDPVSDEFRHSPNTVYVINSDGTNARTVLAGDDFKRRFEWIATP